MQTQRALSGARLLAVLPMPVLCVFAALLGLPATPAGHGLTIETVQPVQSTGWGDRTTPDGSHRFERERLRANATRPGFQSGFALPQAHAFTAPVGAAPLARAAHAAVLAQRSEGAHLGRSPPRNS